ncbi:MAG: hypothetical protein R2722_10975 [Tessaracoccus sp.]
MDACAEPQARSGADGGAEQAGYHGSGDDECDDVAASGPEGASPSQVFAADEDIGEHDDSGEQCAAAHNP